MRVLKPCAASAAPRLMDVVVLPTPPFRLVMAITRPTFFSAPPEFFGMYQRNRFFASRPLEAWLLALPISHGHQPPLPAIDPLRISMSGQRGAPYADNDLPFLRTGYRSRSLPSQ